MRMANEMEVCDMSKKLIMGAVMALALVVCIPQTASAKTKWKLSATSKNLQVGKTSKLTVKNVPKKAKVKWKSSKKSVVKIIKTGKKSAKIKACKPGTAYITARYKGKTKRCRIKVIAKKRIDPQADMPRLNATSVDIYHVDDALKPYMTVDPTHKTTFRFQVTGTKMEVEKWKVSTESGLVISNDGLLTTVWGPGYGTPYSAATLLAAVLWMQPSNGKAEGESGTPDSIINLATKILDVQKEKVADFCCGVGNFLVNAVGQDSSSNYYGIELNKIGRAHV